jgi:hypothetical protein
MDSKTYIERPKHVKANKLSDGSYEILSLKDKPLGRVPECIFKSKFIEVEIIEGELVIGNEQSV